MDQLKYSVWGVWLGSLAAMVFGDGWIAELGRVAFWLTLVAHLVEFLANRAVFERSGGSLGHHFVQTLVYGLFHWVPLRRRLAEKTE